MWPPLCRDGCLYGIERYAGNRSVRRKVQVCGILDRIPFIFPINRLLSDHMFLRPPLRPAPLVLHCESHRRYCVVSYRYLPSPRAIRGRGIESPAEGALALMGAGDGVLMGVRT